MGSINAQAMATSASINPTKMASRRTGVSSSRSKYPFWMSSTSDPARDTPVTPSRIAVGSMNAVMSNPWMWLSVNRCSVPMLITKKNTAMKIGGNDRLQLPRHRPQRPPGDRGNVPQRVRRTRRDPARPLHRLGGVADRGHDATSRSRWSDSGSAARM
jgi:hypothetical protein